MKPWSTKLDNKEFSYSDAELIDEFQTFLMAKTDTTTRFFNQIIFYIENNLKSTEDWSNRISVENLKKKWFTSIGFSIRPHAFTVLLPTEFYLGWSEDNYIKDAPITKVTFVIFQRRGNQYDPKYFKDPNVFRGLRVERRNAMESIPLPL